MERYHRESLNFIEIMRMLQRFIAFIMNLHIFISAKLNKKKSCGYW